MTVTLLAIGTIKDAPKAALLETYYKRLSDKFEIKTFDSSKIKDTHLINNAENNWILEQIALMKQKNPSYVIALDLTGKSLSSEAFTALIQDKKNQAQKIIFIIGGADGLNNSVRQACDFLLSFGKQTWPHMLARIMLVEQLYRAEQITHNGPYHK